MIKDEEERITARRTIAAQTPKDPNTREWATCDEEHCTWTIAGWGDGNGKWTQRRRLPPLKKGEPGEKDQYWIDMDLENGVLQHNKNDRYDDGKGDLGRLDRYRTAFKDHKDRHHSKNATRDMIKIDPPVFTMRMDDIKFKEKRTHGQDIW